MNEATVPIEIELGGSLRALAEDVMAKRAADDVARDATSLLAELGLDGAATVTVEGVGSERAVRVRVHGVVQPYPAAVVHRAWRAVAPPDLVDLPRVLSAPGRFPDSWTTAFNGQGADSRVAPLAGSFIRRLAFELINERPECLVSSGQVASVAARVAEAASASGADVHTEPLADVVAQLLELDVVAAPRHELIESLVLSARVGRALDETVEAAFSRLRPGVVELHIAPEYLASLSGASPIHERVNVQDERFDGLRERFFYLESSLAQIGVRLPDLVWTPSPELPDSSVAVKVNDRVGPPIPLFAAQQLLLNDSVDRLRSRGLAGERFMNPLTGRDNTIVEEASRPQVESFGLVPWTAPDFLLHAIHSQLLRCADRLLGVEEVTYQLAQLELARPELLHEVIGRFSIGEITRLLRALLQERLPIRDLPAILERLVEFDLAGDEQRVAVGAAAARRSSNGQRNGSPAQLAYVRSGLKHMITHAFCQGESILVAHRFPATVETRAADMSIDGDGAEEAHTFDDREREALTDEVWVALSDEKLRPVVVAAPEARVALRAVLARELPDLPVLGTNEIRSDIRLVELNQEGGPMAATTALMSDRVGQILADLVGPALQVDRDGDFTFAHESSRVFVRVSAWRESSTIVTIFALTNVEVPPSPELFKWVALHSGDWIFGHLYVTEEPNGVTIRCLHSLLGDFVDPDELAAAVVGVATTVDEVDDQIKELFGGKLFSE